MLITIQNPNWPAGQALDVPVLDVQVAAGFSGASYRLTRQSGRPVPATDTQVTLDRDQPVTAAPGAGRKDAPPR